MATPESPRAPIRAVPTTRRHNFHHGQDPVTTARRPLLTVGNGFVLLGAVLLGLYATGNLGQVDQAVDAFHKAVQSRNDTVVGSIVSFLPFLLLGGFLIFVAFVVFLVHNHNRRSVSDPKGWHKEVAATPKYVKHVRRADDPPSLLLPLGKGKTAAAEKKGPELVKTQAAPAQATKTAAAAAAVVPAVTPISQREDPPSMIMPLGKVRKSKVSAVSPEVLAQRAAEAKTNCSPTA